MIVIRPRIKVTKKELTAINKSAKKYGISVGDLLISCYHGKQELDNTLGR